MRATTESITERHRLVMQAVDTLGGERNEDTFRTEVSVEELGAGYWFAWCGDQEDSLGGEGATEQEALDDLDRALRERISTALAHLEKARAC